MIHLFREANIILGFATFFGLCYRTPEALAGVTSKRLYLVLIVFPLLAAFASVQALAQHAPSGPVTPVFTVAYLALGVILTIAWPFARKR